MSAGDETIVQIFSLFLIGALPFALFYLVAEVRLALRDRAPAADEPAAPNLAEALLAAADAIAFGMFVVALIAFLGGSHVIEGLARSVVNVVPPPIVAAGSLAVVVFPIFLVASLRGRRVPRSAYKTVAACLVGAPLLFGVAGLVLAEVAGAREVAIFPIVGASVGAIAGWIATVVGRASQPDPPKTDDRFEP